MEENSVFSLTILYLTGIDSILINLDVKMPIWLKLFGEKLSQILWYCNGMFIVDFY